MKQLPGVLLACMFFTGLALVASTLCDSGPLNNYTPVTGIDSVELRGVGFPPGQSGLLSDGASYWNASHCNTAGISFPRFVTSGGDMSINVKYFPGAHPANDRCGDFDIASREISLYGSISIGGSSESCRRAETLAHEIGHFLGLADTNGLCMGDQMMSPFKPGVERQPSPAECSLASCFNETGTEAQIDDPCMSQNPPSHCDHGPPGSDDDYPCGCSPILLDLDGDAFTLEGLDNPVYFDIDDVGEKSKITWTKGDSLDAFLFFDRNRNGRVDHGGELFGTATPLQEGGRAGNGYKALAEFDQVKWGGNANRIIDSMDAIFNHLGLWVDSNHDGISQSQEMVTLHEAQVQAISLGYRVRDERDEHGNWFRFHSGYWRLGEYHRTTDVYFVKDQEHSSE